MPVIVGIILVGLVIGFASGCDNAIVYPGRDVPVALDIDGPTFQYDPGDVTADIKKAIAIWSDPRLSSGGPRFQIGGKADYRIKVHVGSQGPYDTSQSDGGYDTSTGEVWLTAGTGDGGLAQVAAHELGHAIGLQHVKRGIMQGDGAYVAVYTALQPDDIVEYERVWG